MRRVKIIADSTCDLSQELLQQYEIDIIPLMISMGENSYKDGMEITLEQLYTWSDKTGQTPKTAAPTIGDAIEFLRPYTMENSDVIFFGISESMSATCNVLRLAAEELEYKNLTVINSKNLSTGIGLQVLRAAAMAAKGYSAEDILEDNQSIIGKVRSSFVVDTLTFLYRGGRCSGVQALLANTLKLKPEIVVIDGKMEVAKKYRGTQKSVIFKYTREKEEELLEADYTRVFITHSGCPDDIIDEVVRFLNGLNRFKEVIVTRAGGVISSHCGPNTLGILYISK